MAVHIKDGGVRNDQPLITVQDLNFANYISDVKVEAKKNNLCFFFFSAYLVFTGKYPEKF